MLLRLKQPLEELMRIRNLQKHCHSIKRKEKSRALMLKRPLLMMMMMMTTICVQSFAQRDRSKTVRTTSVRSCVARVKLVSTERGTTPTAAVICAPTTLGPQPLALPRLTIVPSVSHTLMLPVKKLNNERVHRIAISCG